MNRQKADPAAMPVAVLEKNQSDKNQRAVILDQLAKIQNSRSFGNSARAKEFFSYVVKQAVDGHTENLKERAIGVNLFDRAPSYMTGEDPIVRVNAAEVRKRLSVYYAEEEPTPEVRIEIPVGSYIPSIPLEPFGAPQAGHGRKSGSPAHCAEAKAARVGNRGGCNRSDSAWNCRGNHNPEACSATIPTR